MRSKLYIPKRINVGCVKRTDTYNGKLAYVIYWDDKGKLRKEASWESWRDEKIKPKAYDNVPTEGFVLNKGVGGARASYGWNTRNEYIRVYDPRGFEFEISVANLLFILQETNSIKGKGLEGEFVYSWSGTDLVLLPTSTLDYRESTKHTNRQSMKVTKKDMVEGCVYTAKEGNKQIYLGRFHYTEFYSDKVVSSEMRHLFYVNGKVEKMTGFTHLATKDGDTPVDNYADLVDIFTKSKNNCQVDSITSKVSGLIYNDISNNHYNWGYRNRYVTNRGLLFHKVSDNVYHILDFYNSKEIYEIGIKQNKSMTLKDGKLLFKTLDLPKTYVRDMDDLNIVELELNLSNGVKKLKY